jgi:hypothetical protein
MAEGVAAMGTAQNCNKRLDEFQRAAALVGRNY